MKRTLIQAVGVVALFLLTVTGTVAAVRPAAPTIVYPTVSSEASHVDAELTITGLAPANTRVAVYIDNTFNGYAEMVSEADGTQSFAYEPFVPLTPGWHELFARAEDVEAGTRSGLSETASFYVEYAFPAPTVLSTSVNLEDGWRTPWIHGVAPSGSTVEVWVNGVLNGTTVATDDESGTGSFAYKPYTDLATGTYTVAARAASERADGTVRQSAVSETYSMSVAYVAPVEATETTTETATEEDSDEAVEEVVEDAVMEESQEETQTEEYMEEADSTEEGEEAMSMENSEEESSEEDSDENTDKESEEGEETEEAADEESEDDSDEESRSLTILGWAFLIIAAIIFARQMRQRRAETTTDSSSSEQLELKTEKSNSVQVVEKEETTENADQSEETAEPVATEAASEAVAETVSEETQEATQKELFNQSGEAETQQEGSSAAQTSEQTSDTTPADNAGNNQNQQQQ